MDAATFRAALKELGLTQQQVSAYLRVTPGAVSRWVKGQRSIPGPVEVLVQQALAKERGESLKAQAEKIISSLSVGPESPYESLKTKP